MHCSRRGMFNKWRGLLQQSNVLQSMCREETSHEHTLTSFITDSFPPFHVCVEVCACTTHSPTSVSHIASSSQLEADSGRMKSTGGGNVGKSEERLLDDGEEGEGKRRGWIELEGTAKKTTRAHTHAHWGGEINGTIFKESRSFFLRGCSVVNQSQTAEWIILWEW